MPDKIEYRELFDLNCASLSKNDLFQIEKILFEDPRTDQLKIEISFDSTSVSADSFEKLLSNPNLPASTDKLSIDMKRWIETEDYRGVSSGVSLSLHFNHINCQIHSIDQTWFLGKKSQIEKFFHSKKPWYIWLNKLSFAYPAIAMTFFFYGSKMLGEKQYSYMVFPLIASALLIVFTILVFKQKIFPFVRIHLEERSKFKFGFSELCASIAALAGLATLAQVLGKLFK